MIGITASFGAVASAWAKQTPGQALHPKTLRPRFATPNFSVAADRQHAMPKVSGPIRICEPGPWPL